MAAAQGAVSINNWGSFLVSAQGRTCLSLSGAERQSHLAVVLPHAGMLPRLAAWLCGNHLPLPAPSLWADHLLGDNHT